MKKSIPLAALFGAGPVAAMLGAGSFVALTDGIAAPAPAILVSVESYSTNGPATFNLSLSTATWTFDPVTGEAVITGGTYYGEVLRPNVFAHSMAGVTLGNFVASGASWSCSEGTFGGVVGASLCGNYNFGSNKINESTYTPSVIGSTVTIGGDDSPLGPSQSLADSYSTMTTTSRPGNQYKLSNATPPVDPTNGYDFIFQLENDTTPDAFIFPSLINVALSSAITSNVITVAGITSPVVISVVGGDYAVNDGEFTTANGTVNEGDTVAVRQTSSDKPATATTVTATIGGVAGTFTATTSALSSGGGDGGSSAMDGLSLLALGLMGWLRRKVPEIYRNALILLAGPMRRLGMLCWRASGQIR